MGKKGRLIIIAAGVVLIPLGWHVGSRAYVLRRLYGNPRMRERMAVVVEELDLSETSVAEKAVCSIGYAEFSLLSADDLCIKSMEESILAGESRWLEFFFLKPFHATLSSLHDGELQSEGAASRQSDPFAQLICDPDATALDLSLAMENVRPVSFWEGVFMGRGEFSTRTARLACKGLYSIGRDGVYTYATAHTRGLVYIGKDKDDSRRAHAQIESSSGNQAVGVHVLIPEGQDGDIVEHLRVLLKTFRFTGDEPPSDEQLAEMIRAAGIEPRP